jgi:hypothetical protein
MTCVRADNGDCVVHDGSGGAEALGWHAGFELSRPRSPALC